MCNPIRQLLASTYNNSQCLIIQLSVFRTQENAAILLQYLGNLFKEDTNSRLSQQTPMLLQLLWQNGMVINSSKLVVKEFVTLCYQSVELSVKFNTKVWHLGCWEPAQGPYPQLSSSTFQPTSSLHRYPTCKHYILQISHP